MKIQAYHTPDILFSILFYSSRCRATNGAHVGQIAQLQVRDIIKHIDDALFPRHANKRDGCIGAREEEFFSQPEHLGGISVDHAAMREDQHPLPYMPTCNFVDSVDHACAESAGWFAARTIVPMARRACDTHDIDLAGGQRLRQCLQVIALIDRGYWTDIAQGDLFDIFNDI